MNRKSYPERVRSALFHAIKKTTANLDACVKVPGKDFSRKRKLPLQTILLMLIGMGGGSLSKELYDWSGYTPSTATAGHLLLLCAKRAATTKIDLFAYLR